MKAAGEAVAGIVVYHPDEAQLLKLVAALREDVGEVAIYANSPIEDDVEQGLRAAAAPAALLVLRPGRNLGLGVAYDAILARAEALGAPFAFLLDQDSFPVPGTVPKLVALHRELADAGLRPAIVGPRPIAPDGRPMKLASGGTREAGPAGAVAVDFVISSGSLVSVDAARDVGPFRADYFIDAIDIEWCLRAGARGYSIWVGTDVAMDHRLGRGVIRLPFGVLLADQPPRRLYTYLRNQISMMRLRHVPLGHKLKTAVSLPARLIVYLARNGFSRDCRRALLNGLVDGARDRLGSPDHALRPLRSSSPEAVPDRAPR